MAERSFWGDYANRSKRPAPRPALYNRLGRPATPSTSTSPSTPETIPEVVYTPGGSSTTPPKKKPTNPLVPAASAAATLGIKPAVTAVANAVSNPSLPTPTFAETPFGPTAAPVDLIPGASGGGAGMGGSTPVLGMNPAAGPAAAIVATLPSWKEGYDSGSVSEGFKEAPWWAKGAGATGGLVGSVFNSKGHPDHQKRKGANEALRSSGFLDENYNIQGPNGAFFNIGEDETHGGTKVSGQEGAMIEGRTPGNRAYNLDWNDPMTGEYVGSVQPLVDILLPNGSDEVARGQMTSKLVNAAVSSGDPMGFIKHLYTQGGYTDRNSAYNKVLELSQDAERLPPERRDAYLAAIDKMYGVPGAGSSGPAAAAPQSSGGSGGSGSRTPPPLAQPLPPVAPAPPPAPTGPDVNFPQAIADTYAYNTSDPVMTQLNPVTAPPFTPNQPSALDLQPLARRRQR